MFAKITKYPAIISRRAAVSPVAPAHSNDNWIAARGASAVRPVLACRWRPVGGGRLECRWHIEMADGPATEEPDGRWSIRGIYGLFGIATAGRRLALPAMA
jgi:hypothetical protein